MSVNLPLVAVAAAGPLLLLFQFIVMCYISKRNMNAEREERAVVELAAQQRPETRTGLSLDDVDKLPHSECKDDTCIKGTEPACPVCLEAFRPGEKCRLVPSCKHVFHMQCLDSWLLNNASCPICRADVKSVDSEEQQIIVVISNPQDSSSA